MKRFLCSIILLMIFLTGCGSPNASLKSNQIQYKGKTLTYGSDKIDDVFLEDGIKVRTNAENSIRAISITNNDVVTYNGISVGDSITAVESMYNHAISVGSSVLVLLSGNKEIEPTSENKPSNSIWIAYSHDNGIITKIEIYDIVYGTEMK